MIEALPRRAFFRFEMPILRREFGVAAADVKKWDAAYMLPALVEVEDEAPLADVYAGWSPEGMHFLFDVPERTTPLSCDPKQWYKKDGLRICIDTRDTRDARRQTRFCSFFYALPVGGGSQRRAAVVGVHKMSHAKEAPPPVDVSAIDVATSVRKRGYTIEVAIPASCMNGWDPEQHARIGLFYKLKDIQLGSQHLSATDELGWNADPSTWATGRLVG